MVRTPGSWIQRLDGPGQGPCRPLAELPAADPLRDLAHQIVDMIVDRQSSLRHSQATKPEQVPTLPPLSDEPADLAEVLGHLVTGLTGGHRLDHPRYFGYVPTPVDPAAILADMVTTGFATFAGMAQTAPGAHRIELDVIDWLNTELSQPSTSGGVFLPGGSVGNLTGLVAALYGRDRSKAIVYGSEQTHSSLAKACATLGVEFCRVPATTEGTICADRLRDIVDRDGRPGSDREPAVIVANYGTTSTGAVDDLGPLRQVADDHGLWLHVDGAFGLAAAIAGDGLPVVIDSAMIDAHKWLFCSLETTCLLVRDPERLRRAFTHHAPYLVDMVEDQGELESINFSDLGPQLSRQARAVRLWAVLQVHGVEGVKAAVKRGIDLARAAEHHIITSPDWELRTPASLCVVTFAHREGDEVTRRLSDAARHDGYAFVSSTTVGGRPAVRMCTNNPASTIADVTSALDRLAQLANALAATAHA